MTRADIKADEDDMGALWREYAAARQEQRALNRQGSAWLLHEAGIPFETNNDGAHLIVRARGETIDFWPGTGLWIRRGTNQRKRGVGKLLAFCKD